jgi:hypothetical protein
MAATNLEIIFSCLKHSDLPREDQERFLGLCSMMGDEGLKNIAATLRDHPHELPAFLKIMDLKWQALRTKSADAFREVVKAEVAELKK